MEHLKERTRRLSQAALSIQTGSHLILGLGTVWAAWQGATGYLSTYLEGGTLHFTCALVSILAYKILDGGMKTTVPFVFAYLVGNEKKDINLPAYLIWSAVVLAFFQLGLSVWGNLIIAPDIAATVVQPAQIAAPEVDNATAQYETDRAAMVDVVAQKKRAVAELIAQRNAEKISAIPAPIMAGAQSGNNWAIGEKKKYEATIERRYRRTINNAREDLKEAENRLQAFIAQRGGQVENARARVIESEIEQSARADAKVVAWADFFRALMIVSLVLFLASTLLVCAYEDTIGEKVFPELTVGYVATKAWNSVHSLALKRAEKTIDSRLTEPEPLPAPVLPEKRFVAPPAPLSLGVAINTPVLRTKAPEAPVKRLTDDECKELIKRARARARYHSGEDEGVKVMLQVLRDNGFTAQVDETDSKRLKISKP
jgi:hypothetical protein